MTNTATAKNVRAAHNAAGNDVKITRDGHVTYRAEGDTMWMDGRWVEEYRCDDAGIVFL